MSELLVDRKYNVFWLSRERHIKAEIPRYKWDYKNKEIDIQALEKADIIIHLAGSNIGDELWSTRKKQEIVESRVETAKLLLEKLKSLNKKPEAFITASAVGFYGMLTVDKIFTEEDMPAHNDFLSQTCKKWEEAAFCFQDELNIRTIAIRTSFVISTKSEAFKKMVIPVRFGLAAPLGTGNQYTSWIHLEDICGIYLKAIEDSTMQGVYNASAPEHVTNKEFMHSLAKEMRRPFILPNVPKFILKLFMGEASGTILEGSRISSQKIIDKGYEFQYSTVEKAFRNSLNL